MANSFHFNAVDLSGVNYGVTVLNSTMFPVSPVPRIDIQPVAYGASVSQRRFFEPRGIQLDVRIAGTSSDNLEERLMNLSTLFAQTEDKSLRLDSFRSAWYFLCRYTGGLENVEYRGLQAAKCSLTFIAPDPIGYSVTERTSPDISITSTNHDFDMESAAAVAGNWYATPVWIIKATNGATNPSITNTTTDETYTWSSSLSSGSWLKVDSRTMQTTMSSDEGETWSNYELSVSGRYPRLLGGTQNSLNVSGVVAGGSLSITYRARIL
jgi:hypothetical protein